MSRWGTLLDEPAVAHGAMLNSLNCSIDQLKLRKHRYDPEQVFHSLVRQRLAEDLLGRGAFGVGWLAAERLVEAGVVADAGLSHFRPYLVGVLGSNKPAGFGAQAYHFPTVEALIEALRDELAAADAIKAAQSGMVKARMAAMVSVTRGPDRK